MFIDARTELNPPTSLERGTYGTRVIDLASTGGKGRFDLDASLIVADKRGTVGATLQASHDGEQWAEVCSYADLPAGQMPVRVPGFSKRYVRVLWRITEQATVTARINNSGEI